MQIRDTLVAIIFAITLPMVYSRPYWGVYLWSWVGYMNPHRLGWGFMYSFPVAQLIALITLGSFVVSGERKRFPYNLILIVWGAFIFWLCFTTVFAYHRDEALIQLNRTLKIQLFIALTLMMINNRERLELLVWVIAFSIGFFGIKGGIFTLIKGGGSMVLGPPSSFIEGNNEIGFAITLILPLFNYLRLSVNNKLIKHLLFLSIVLCSFAILGSNSRGAFLALGASLFVLWLQSSKKVFSAVIILSVAALSLSFMPQKFFDRMSTIKTYEQDASAMGRINSWNFAYNLSLEHPFTGGGFGAFSKELFELYAPDPLNHHDAHSIYFEVLGEQGYIGLFLFLLIGLLSWNNARFVIKYSRLDSNLSWAAELAKMIQVSLVGYAVGGAFLGLAYFDLPYHFMAILILLREIVEKKFASKMVINGQ